MTSGRLLFVDREGAEESRGIRNVHISCTEGSVQWKQPLGAIRVIFSQRQSAAAFELCFVTESHDVLVEISNETQHGLKPLVMLSPGGHRGGGDDEVCVHSHRGHDVVLFVESVLTAHSAPGMLQIDYDVRREFEPPQDSPLFTSSGE